MKQKIEEPINIFFILSPLQLLNAIEACESFSHDTEQEKNILIIGYTLNKRNNEQINNILSIYAKWDVIEKINIIFTMKELFFRILWLSKKFQNTSISKVFLGEFRIDCSWILANNCQASETILLDDGLGTLRLSEEKLAEQTGSKIKNILTKLCGLKDAKRVSPAIFTIFDLPKDTPYKIIKNDFSYLQKTLVNDTESQNKVYFLGAPLSDVGIISQDYFISNLYKIFKFYKDKKLIYIIHRRENMHFMQKKFPDIQFIMFDNIVEIEFLLKKIRPIHIASFYSAALYTLSTIYKIKSVDVFKLDINKINYLHRQNIGKVYHLYNQFNTINLEEIS